MAAYGINFVDPHNNVGNNATPGYMDYYNDAIATANEYRPGDIISGNWLKREEDLKREMGQLVYSAEQAKINRDFTERLSNTEVQRRVKDLAAAGFSPMMLLSGSAGASTPSGSAATASGFKSSTSKKSGLGDLAALAIRVLGLLALKH